MVTSGQLAPILIRSSRGDYRVEFADVAGALRAEPPSTFFVVDDTVMRVQAERLGGLEQRGRIISVTAKETMKTAHQALLMTADIVAAGFRRDERLVAIGGGVVQDLTGFIASILYRGVEWGFYPTTLVAQADSCIGGKTSINMGGSKNLLGTFHPPRNIVIDSGFLETLPPHEIRSGIGEMLHYFLFEGFERAEALAAAHDDLINSPRLLAPLVRASLEIKSRVIEADEFDRGVRNLFNYGHTFGHALEAASDYAVTHGEAVTWGMDLANELSWRLGLLERATFDRMRSVITSNLPAYALPADRMDAYFGALSRDKKNTGSTLGCILTRGPGRMEKVQLPMDESLRAMIIDYVTRSRAALHA